MTTKRSSSSTSGARRPSSSRGASARPASTARSTRARCPPARSRRCSRRADPVRRADVGLRRRRAAASTRRCSTSATPRRPRVPVLGICYGLQALAHALGGASSRPTTASSGARPLVAHAEDALFRGVPEHSTVWMSHGDRLTRLPAGFRSIAATDNAPIAAVAANRLGTAGLRRPVPPRGGPLRRRRRACSATSCSASAAARRLDDGLVYRREGRDPAPSATTTSSWASPAASTRRSPRRSCTAPSATS